MIDFEDCEYKPSADDIHAENRRLRAENARLREALRPFADLADKIEAANDDDDYHFPAAKISDLRAARAAMGETE